MDERDPFAVHDDGTVWPDASLPDLPPSKRKKTKISKLGETAEPKVKKADLESKTRDLLRGMGMVYGRTEQHNSWSGVTKDLFGCIDGVAVGAQGIWFVQTCARSTVAAHVRKMATGTFKIGNGAPAESYDATRYIAESWARTVSDDAMNVRLVIVMWDQPDGPGTKWRHELRFVTRTMLDECRGRQRK